MKQVFMKAGLLRYAAPRQWLNCRRMQRNAILSRPMTQGVHLPQILKMHENCNGMLEIVLPSEAK